MERSLIDLPADIVTLYTHLMGTLERCRGSQCGQALVRGTQTYTAVVVLTFLHLPCCVPRVSITVRLIKTIRRKNPEVQLLLFSATYNDKVKEFAMRIAPNANQVWCDKIWRWFFWFWGRVTCCFGPLWTMKPGSQVAQLSSCWNYCPGMLLACSFHCPP